MGSPTRQLFGTDGIRGIAGEFPLTVESTYLIGRALGHDLIRTATNPRVVIGQDTRESSAWIADRVMLGLTSAGVETHSAGVITTPGVAYLARSRKYTAGVVISASHNPWTDNGIKVFSGNGFKLPDSHELAIEQEIFGLLKNPQKHAEGGGSLTSSLPGEAALRRAYIEWLAANVHADLSRLRVWWTVLMEPLRRKRRSCFALAGFRQHSSMPLRTAGTSTKIAVRCIRRW